MTSQRRRPGRPAHGSREKLVAAACELFAERGFTATSPTMVLIGPVWATGACTTTSTARKPSP